MTLGLLGVLDLHKVTSTLTDLLKTYRDNSPLATFKINISSSMPETVRNESDCQLSLYLFYVSQDKFQRNIVPPGLRSSTVPQQPMSLDLYYLLTAFSGKEAWKEQRAMSIALKCFHENPIVHMTVTIEGQDVDEEFTLTMEMEASDELSRLWQALTTPFRLSTIYKVSVVFLTPEAPVVTIAPNPQRIGLSVHPTPLPYLSDGQVFGTSRLVFYTSPTSTPGHLINDSFDLFPATVAPGQSFLLNGAGFTRDSAKQLYLVMPDGTEQNVTAWIVPAPPPSDDQFVLKLPTPPNTPPAGVYQLRVGRDAPLPKVRSNATPFSIAAFVEPPAAGNMPILPLTGGQYVLNGAGFLPGKTQVLLDTIPLDTGDVTISAGENTLSIKAPASLTTGRYTVRVRVNQIESDPAWWIDIP